MEDNNKKAEENASHWDDYAGTWIHGQQYKSVQEIDKKIQRITTIDINADQENKSQVEEYMDAVAEKRILEELHKEKQRIIDMQEHPEKWSEGTSVQVETTEEQREVLNQIKERMGLKSGENGLVGPGNNDYGRADELSLEDKMKVLQSIKGHSIEPTHEIGIKFNLADGSTRTETYKVNKMNQEALEDSNAVSQSISQSAAIYETGDKPLYDRLQKMMEDKVEELYQRELHKQGSDDPLKVIQGDIERQLSKLPEEVQVEIATRILDKVVTNKQQEEHGTE